MSQPSLDFFEKEPEDGDTGTHGWKLVAGGNNETLVTSDELFHDRAEAEDNFTRVIEAGIGVGGGPNIAELLDLLGASGIGAVHIEEEDGVDAHWEVSLPDEALAELAQHEPEAASSDEVAKLKEEVVEIKRELARLQLDRDNWKKKARNRR